MPNEMHAHHQLGGDRGPANGAVVLGHVRAHEVEVENRVDAAEQVAVGTRSSRQNSQNNVASSAWRGPIIDPPPSTIPVGDSESRQGRTAERFSNSPLSFSNLTQERSFARR